VSQRASGMCSCCCIKDVHEGHNLRVAIFLRAMPYVCVSWRVMIIPCHDVSVFLGNIASGLKKNVKHIWPSSAKSICFCLSLRVVSPGSTFSAHNNRDARGGEGTAPHIFLTCLPSTSGYVGAKYVQEFGARFFHMSSASGYMGAKYVQEFGPRFLACHVPNVACHGVSIPIVSISSVLCGVRILRVSVSMACRGHPVYEGRA